MICAGFRECFVPLASTANQFLFPSGSSRSANDVDGEEEEEEEGEEAEEEELPPPPLLVRNSTSLPAAGGLSSSSASERDASRAGRADEEKKDVGDEAERGLYRERLVREREKSERKARVLPVDGSSSR